jgi:hypothetical protein
MQTQLSLNAVAWRLHVVFCACLFLVMNNLCCGYDSLSRVSIISGQDQNDALGWLAVQRCDIDEILIAMDSAF